MNNTKNHASVFVDAELRTETNPNPNPNTNHQPPTTSSCQSIRVVASYLPKTNSYLSRTSIEGPDHVRRRQSSTLSQYISHAFARGAKTNYLFAYMLFFNLIMSVLNTVLLSFIVKSIQLQDFSLNIGPNGVNSPSWNEHFEAIELNLPISFTGQNRVLAVNSIESISDKPLVVQSLQRDHKNRGDQINNGQIIIGATQSHSLDDDGLDRRSNHIIVNKQHRDGPESDTQGEETNHQEPLEVVSNRFILTGQPADRFDVTRKKLQQQNQQEKQQSKRLLEFDAKQDSIELTTMDQISLYPIGASDLIVGELLRSQSKIGGAIGTDFDIQNRHGNLTCESDDALRLVSKSSRLNLAARQTLVITGANLKLEAKQLNLVDGIEFLDDKDEVEKETQSGATNGGDGQPNGQQMRLAAYSLVLVDGKLMASDNR